MNVDLTLPAPLTAATALRLWPDTARTGTPAEVPVTGSTVDGWTVDTGTLVGRFYGSVVGTGPGGAATVPVSEPFDLPDDPRLVVSPEHLAVRAGIPLPLTGDQRDLLVDALLDAQADVEAYLGQPPVPTLYRQSGVYAYDGEEWGLSVHGDAAVHRIVTVTPELVDGVPSGYYTITYTAGLDARSDPALRPVRRYVVAHALNAPDVLRLWQTLTGARGEIRSVSAEGQSISWGPATHGGGGDPGSGRPGALPTLSSLDYWRVAGRRVHQAPTRARVWPYPGV